MKKQKWKEGRKAPKGRDPATHIRDGTVVHIRDDTAILVVSNIDMHIRSDTAICMANNKMVRIRDGTKPGILDGTCSKKTGPE